MVDIESIKNFHNKTAFEHGVKHFLEKPDDDIILLANNHTKYIASLLKAYGISNEIVAISSECYSNALTLGFKSGGNIEKEN